MPFGKRQPAGYCGVERRRHPREKVNLSARVLLPTGHTIPCQISDISRGGARLSISAAFGMPESFELRFGGQVHHVSVTRRGIGQAAVQFA